MIARIIAGIVAAGYLALSIGWELRDEYARASYCAATAAFWLVAYLGMKPERKGGP